MIQLFSNSLGREELKAVSRVFKSRWLGYGKEAEAFEREFADKINTRYLLMMNSCSAALLTAVRALGLRRGEEVIMPSIGFVACASVVIEARARPIFADVDPHYLNILPSEIERLRTPRTRAVLLLHYGGHPCDMAAIYEASKGLLIIEDSANSILSSYRGQSCGTLGDAGVFSFDPMKFLVTGDGGALCLKDKEVYEKAKEFRYLGILNRKSGIDSHKKGDSRWWEFQIGCISNRFLPNDIAATIGRVQLKKLDEFIAKRERFWTFYQRELRDVQWIDRPPEPLDGTESSYYMYWIKVKEGYRDKLANWLTSLNVYCTFRYFPLHLVKYYQSNQRLPNSENANRNVLCLPLHQNLSYSDLGMIVELIKKFGKKYVS